jgi:hypothetical protein
MPKLIVVDQILIAKRNPSNPLHHHSGNLMLHQIG